jgi:hypothetical protein
LRISSKPAARYAVPRVYACWVGSATLMASASCAVASGNLGAGQHALLGKGARFAAGDT